MCEDELKRRLTFTHPNKIEKSRERKKDEKIQKIRLRMQTDMDEGIMPHISTQTHTLDGKR